MGIWDYVCSSTDSLKRNSPDLTPIINYSTSYIGNAVKVPVKAADLQALKQYLPDDQARKKIAQFTTCLAKNAAFETIKFVPGGVLVRKVVTKSYEEVYKSEESQFNKKALDCEDFKCQIQTAPELGSTGHEEPADVIRSFMMKGFMGRQFLDCLIVPGTETKAEQIHNTQKNRGHRSYNPTTHTPNAVCQLCDKSSHTARQCFLSPP